MISMLPLLLDKLALGTWKEPRRMENTGKKPAQEQMGKERAH